MLKSFTKTQSIFLNNKCFHKREMVTFSRKGLLMKFHSSNLVIYARMEQNPNPEILPNFTVYSSGIENRAYFGKRYHTSGRQHYSSSWQNIEELHRYKAQAVNMKSMEPSPKLKLAWCFCYIISFYTSSSIVLLFFRSCSFLE